LHFRSEYLMKKFLSSKSTLTLVLLILLNVSSKGNIYQEEEIWTQPFRQCWSYPSNKILAEFSASDNVKVFIPSLSGEIKAINSLNGNILWTTELGGEIVSEIITDKDKIYVLNENTITEESKEETTSKTITSLRSLDANSGITNWKKTFNLDTKANLYIHEELLILTSENGYLTGISSKDGTTVWEKDIKSQATAASQTGGKITIATSDKKIVIISSINGNILKEIDIKDSVANSLLSTGETILWGNNKGFLYNLNLLNGQIVWKRRFGGEIRSITETSNGILISSIDNFIYLINKNTGKINWKRRLAARVTEKPFIRGNMAIVFAFGDSTALIVELNKGRVINSLTLSDANYFVGNVYSSNNFLIFSTLSGLYAFGNVCEAKEKTGL
jgi:outer membrane protein assembly factor BamB